MTETAETFARTLRRLRVLRGMSQQQLAERAGLSENAVGAFERAERFPRASTIDALAAALNAGVEPLVVDLLREPEASYTTDDGRDALLRELAALIHARPERFGRLVLDLARRIDADLTAEEP